MNRQALIKAILQLPHSDFDALALAVFQYQVQYNPLYAQYLKYLSIQPESITKVTDIPFLPIQFFKNYEIKTKSWEAECIFRSSGTTASTQSQHFVRDLVFYNQVSQLGFEHFYKKLEDYCILALLPAYLERKDASLVYMTDYFIRQSRYPQSGFFLHDTDRLIQALQQSITQKIPTILIGVSFALLDLAEKYPMNLKNIILMETGGMKGKRKELTRQALHQIFKENFQSNNIHSEYGMTELLSQAYSLGNGIFYPSPTMRVSTREITDPLQAQVFGKTGGINVIDLANIDTCAFIAIEDLGRVWADGRFEVLGRFDNSDVRGCNLMVF